MDGNAPGWRPGPGRRPAARCFPQCAGCGQEEEPFPSMREAVRVLEGYGWRRVPALEAWDDDAGWRPGFPWAWYCPPCHSRWDSARRQLQKGFYRRYRLTSA